MNLNGIADTFRKALPVAASLVIFTLCASVASAQCLDNFFSVKPAISAGSNSRSVIFGDFNRDGFNDIAVASTGDSSIHVRLGDGLGGYGSASVRSVGLSPVVVVTADFNKDGRLDLAVTNQGDGTISVANGNGDGTFASPETLTTGGSPEGLVAADFNSDGRMDLAAAYQGGAGGVHVFYGKATGFDPPINLSVGVGPRIIRAADMDLSGTPDLVIIYDNADPGQGKVSIRYKNSGGNLFSGFVDVSVDDYTVAMSIGDVNNDKYPDVATANFYGDSVSVVMSQDAPNGAYSVETIDTDDFPASVVVADMNQDGKGDVGVVSEGSGGPTAAILIGNGAGTFTPTSEIPLSVTPYAVGVTDYNLDAKPDIVSVGGSSITVLENACPLYSGAITGLDAQLPGPGLIDADYCIPEGETFSGSGRQYDAAVADYNLCGESGSGFTIDAFTPTATTIVEPDPIAITTTSSGGTTTSSVTQAVTYVATSSGRPALSLTGDGTNNALDAYLRLKFYKKEGSSYVEKTAKIIDTEIVSDKTGALTQADIDGDGIVEFLIVDADNAHVFIEKIIDPEGAVPVFQNHKTVAVGSLPIKIKPGDFNKDGKDDFVTINEGSKTMSVYITEYASPLLESSQSYSLGGGSKVPLDMTVSDINMDGDLDVLVGTTDGLVSMIGDGSGSFAAAETIASGGKKVLSVKTADMNVDGKTDIMTTTKDTITDETKLETTISTVVPGTSEQFKGVKGAEIDAPEDSTLMIKKLNGDGQPDLMLNSTTNRTPVWGDLYSAPLANDDEYSVLMGGVLNVSLPGVIANDKFPLFATASAEIISGPVNSTGFVLNANGSFSYTASSYNGGTDSFTYRLKDGTLVSPPATVSISIGDSTPPVITPTVNGTVGNNDWYTSNIEISWSVVDAESSVLSQLGCEDVTVSSDTAGTTYTCAALSGGGSNSNSVTVKRDATAPVLTPSVSPNPVLLGGSASASANASDATSGVASQSCGTPNTASVGFKTVACTATDNAGNVGNVNAPYQVIYDFAGFFHPVDMMPVINDVKAGQTVPIRFSLSGYQGMLIIAAGYPVVSTVPCSASEPSSAIEETSGPGSSDLTYDAATDRYQYSWKTKKGDKGTCQIVVIQLIDGTSHWAKFRLK